MHKCIPASIILERNLRRAKALGLHTILPNQDIELSDKDIVFKNTSKIRLELKNSFSNKSDFNSLNSFNLLNIYNKEIEKLLDFNKTIPLCLSTFKEDSKKKHNNHGFEKLSHAKEALAKEKGFSCYRAYRNKYEEYYNKLLLNITDIINEHKRFKNKPLILVVDTNNDYIEELRSNFKKDFEVFEAFNGDLLKEGRKISFYDIVSLKDFNDLSLDLQMLYNETNIDVLFLSSQGEIIEVMALLNVLKGSVPDSIFNKLFQFQTDIRDSKNIAAIKILTDPFEILCVAIYCIFNTNQKNKFSEDEVLNKFSNYHFGLPGKTEIKTRLIDSVETRLLNLTESILRRELLPSNIKTTNVQDVMHFFNSNSARILNIHGGTGSGKTILLKEIEKKLTTNMLLYIDLKKEFPLERDSVIRLDEVSKLFNHIKLTVDNNQIDFIAIDEVNIIFNYKELLDSFLMEMTGPIRRDIKVVLLSQEKLKLKALSHNLIQFMHVQK